MRVYGVVCAHLNLYIESNILRFKSVMSLPLTIDNSKMKFALACNEFSIYTFHDNGDLLSLLANFVHACAFRCSFFLHSSSLHRNLETNFDVNFEFWPLKIHSRQKFWFPLPISVCMAHTLDTQLTYDPSRT